MRLRELIFQGVLGDDSPRRLRPKGSLARLDLPAGMSVEQLHDLLIACLYPKHVTEEHRDRLQFSDDVKIAAVLKSKRGQFRIIRRAEPESVRLQHKKKGGYQDVASGASKVESVLRDKLDFPRLQTFFPLHLWRFDPDQIPTLELGAEFGDDPRIPEVVQEYLKALEVESLEDEIKEVEAQIEDGRNALGEGAKVADKLEQAREKLDEIAVDDLSEEQMDLLQNKDERLDSFHEQLERLQEQEDTEAEQIKKLLPEKPVRRQLFWAGIAVAVLALAASFVLYESHRIVAIGAIPGFAIVGVELLKYFNNLGRASLHKVRMESIRRRINQLREEEILFRERIDHMLLHSGVENEQELRDRIPKAEKLRGIIDQLEEKLESIQRDPDYRRARDELDSLQTRLEELRERREQLPSFVMNSFQLEDDLKSLGVDPTEVVERAERDEGDEDDRDDAFDTPFEWLRAVAEWTGQWNGGELEKNARAMWSKICGHVLSERFDDIDLTAQGNLEVAALTEEQLEMWQNTRSSEVHAVVVALALSLHINQRKKKRGKAFSSVWIAEPADAMTPSHAEKFSSIFKSAAKESQIVICQAT